MNKDFLSDEHMINRALASINRMWAVSLRHLRQMRGDIGRLIHIFYWPFMDLTVFGFMASWVQQDYAQDTNLLFVILVAMVAWEIVARANMDVSIHFLEDIMDNNVVNMFASPLSLREWAGGILMLSVVNVTVLFFFCVLVIELLYRLNILVIGFAIAPFLFNLFIAGLAIGFFATGLLVYFGRAFLGVMYMMGWFFSPFSGAFYPIEVLPYSLRIIAQTLPLSYAIQGIRLLVQHGTISWRLWTISLLMSSIYLVCSLIFFARMFSLSKRKGLARLSD